MVFPIQSLSLGLTWLRFTSAGVLLALWQWKKGKLEEFRSLRKQDWLRIAAAGSLLITNYTTFTWSLDYLLPSSALLSFQIPPLFLALGGMLFLKEAVYWQQWLCFIMIGVGMVLFFHLIFGQNTQSSVWLGFIIVQISAAAWAMYALLQKSLFKQLVPSNILLVIYLYAAITMLPFSEPSTLLSMTFQDMWITVFCCLNTLFAYGSFAQALHYWKTVQVSALTTLTPVVAFVLTELCVANYWWPDRISSSHPDILSLFGMFVVIISAIGVQIISASHKKPETKIKALFDKNSVKTTL